jgi:hypothetical protein
MSEEQVLENMDAEVLETEDEDLLEFKASMGDPSEVPEPSTKKTDEKPKGKGDSMPKMNTKAGMITAAVQAMSQMKKQDLKAAYDKMFDGEDPEENEKVPVDEDAPRALSSITSADIDISEDVDAIFNGSELTEEHKEKIQLVFEAAVVAKINEEIAKFAVEVESDAEITNTQIVELLGKVKNFEKEVVFAESTDELTDTQVAKLRSLAEGIEFVSEKDFSKKVSMLKAQYFDIAEETVETVIVDDENDPVAIEEEKQGPTGAMARYTSAISRSAKK